MGTRGKTPEPKPAVKFTPGVPPPPDWLDDEAQAEYRRVAAAMEAAGGDYLQTVDLADLCTYAQGYSDVRRLTEVVRADGGESLRSDKGNLYPNPNNNALSMARTAMFKAAARLGFSPWDRARMSGKGGKTRAGKDDPLAQFLR